MTKEEAIKILKEQQSRTDRESQHWEADDVLCELLKAIGYADVVVEYNKVPKWYS